MGQQAHPAAADHRSLVDASPDVHERPADFGNTPFLFTVRCPDRLAHFLLILTKSVWGGGFRGPRFKPQWVTSAGMHCLRRWGVCDPARRKGRGEGRRGTPRWSSDIAHVPSLYRYLYLRLSPQVFGPNVGVVPAGLPLPSSVEPAPLPPGAALAPGLPVLGGGDPPAPAPSPTDPAPHLHPNTPLTPLHAAGLVPNANKRPLSALEAADVGLPDPKRFCPIPPPAPDAPADLSALFGPGLAHFAAMESPAYDSSDGLSSAHDGSPVHDARGDLFSAGACLGPVDVPPGLCDPDPASPRGPSGPLFPPYPADGPSPGLAKRDDLVKEEVFDESWAQLRAGGGGWAQLSPGPQFVSQPPWC